MRVLLDTTYARRGPSGTGVYIARIAPALRALGVEVEEVAHDARRPPAGGGAGSVRNLLADLHWTERELPRLARATRADLIHHPLPAAAHRAPCPQVVTVHDLAFERLPECFDPRFRRLASRTHRAAAHRAGAVICVSETTATDAAARWGIPRERIVVARHGPGQEPAGDHARGGELHFLYVGDTEPRKNLRVLLDAYARYRERSGPEPLPLVLAGGVETIGAREGVELAPRPGTERLASLYADAAALVHPSLHEGFGLVPLEALSAGVPVLAARSPGIAEVCGDAALYADPRDPESFAAGLALLHAEPERRRDLAERGRRRAAEFSWARAARSHVKAYTLALDMNPGRS
jgi:glycosyltransferase involved in cell wall biosynthesis